MTTDRSTELSIAPGNAEALRGWDGDDGQFWAAHDRHFDAMMGLHTERLLTAASISTDDRVLDVGCGTGRTTRDAARLASGGAALGIDLSSPLLTRARQRLAAEGPPNAQFVLGDAQIYPFAPGRFDVVISRMGCMFFADPKAAFANIARGLKPGGRMALMTWQAPDRNECIREVGRAIAQDRPLPVPPPGAPGPFSFAAPRRAGEVLRAAGFTDLAFQDVQETLYYGQTVAEAYDFMTGFGLPKGMLRSLDAEQRLSAQRALLASLQAHAGPTGVGYGSAVWIITARR